jgi:hypothetical protein
MTGMTHLARGSLAGDGNECVVQARPLDTQRFDAGFAIDQ